MKRDKMKKVTQLFLDSVRIDLEVPNYVLNLLIGAPPIPICAPSRAIARLEYA